MTFTLTQLADMTSEQFTAAVLSVGGPESPEGGQLIERRARVTRIIDMGNWEPSCAYCRQAGEPGGFFPAHTASVRCESGRRAHCSCSTCF